MLNRLPPFLLRACVVLGVVFILSSLCILGKAIHDLATKLLPEVVRVKPNPKGSWCRNGGFSYGKI